MFTSPEVIPVPTVKPADPSEVKVTVVPATPLPTVIDAAVVSVSIETIPAEAEEVLSGFRAKFAASGAALFQVVLTVATPLGTVAVHLLVSFQDAVPWPEPEPEFGGEAAAAEGSQNKLAACE
jgi:hypothetical protein